MAETKDIDELIDKISKKGFRKHGNEFENINSDSDMRKHIESTLNDDKTKGFCRKDGGEAYFNEQSKTIIIISPNNIRDGGTCYRWNEKGTSFNYLVESEFEHHNIAPAVHKQNAFQKLHPDFQKKIEAEPVKEISWLEAQRNRAKLHEKPQQQTEQDYKHETLNNASPNSQDRQAESVLSQEQSPSPTVSETAQSSEKSRHRRERNVEMSRSMGLE